MTTIESVAGEKFGSAVAHYINSKQFLATGNSYRAAVELDKAFDLVEEVLDLIPTLSYAHHLKSIFIIHADLNGLSEFLRQREDGSAED